MGDHGTSSLEALLQPSSKVKWSPAIWGTTFFEVSNWEMKRVKKEALNRIRTLSKRLFRMDFRIESLRSQAERTTSMLNGVPTGSAMHSQIESSIIKLMSVIEEMEKDQAELSALKAELSTELNALNPLEAVVIQMRYIDALSFRKIADIINRSTNIHRVALKKILQG